MGIEKRHNEMQLKFDTEVLKKIKDLNRGEYIRYFLSIPVYMLINLWADSLSNKEFDKNKEILDLILALYVKKDLVNNITFMDSMKDSPVRYAMSDAYKIYLKYPDKYEQAQELMFTFLDWIHEMCWIGECKDENGSNLNQNLL